VLDEAHAFWLRGPWRGEIRPVALPEPGSGDVVVRTLRSGVSRGTETLVFRGGVPTRHSVAMRAPFQEGNFPGPVKYSYLNVGALEQGSPELHGRTAFSLYPHQTAYGDAEVRLSLGGAFRAGRLGLRGSRVGTVSPARSPRRTTADRLAARSTCCATPPSMWSSPASRASTSWRASWRAWPREPAGALPHDHLRRGIARVQRDDPRPLDDRP
jgi:hypothetical protein